MWPIPACETGKEPKLRQHDYSAQFSLKHMAKDLRLAVETAHDLSLSLGQTEHLKDAYDQGIAAGWKNDDFIGSSPASRKTVKQTASLVSASAGNRGPNGFRGKKRRVFPE